VTVSYAVNTTLGRDVTTNQSGIPLQKRWKIPKKQENSTNAALIPVFCVQE
jgi:hypothetical protein